MLTLAHRPPSDANGKFTAQHRSLSKRLVNISKLNSSGLARDCCGMETPVQALQTGAGIKARGGRDWGRDLGFCGFQVGLTPNS